MRLAINDKEAAEVLLASMYGANSSDAAHNLHPLHFNVRVYAVADYVGLTNLRVRAQQNFNDAALPIISQGGISTFIGAAKLANAETAPIAHLCVANKEQLFKDPVFKAALIEVPELAVDITYVFANELPTLGHGEYPREVRVRHGYGVAPIIGCATNARR